MHELGENDVDRRGRRESVEMACLAFKGSPAHAHRGKDVPTSDADDGDATPCACVCGGASASDSGDADGGQSTHVHTGVHAPASEPGSAALRVAKGITVSINEARKSYNERSCLSGTIYKLETCQPIYTCT